MKFSKNLSSQRRISRKKYYKGNSDAKRKSMSSRINKNLLKSLTTKSISIRKGDEVKVSRGSQKGKIGKIVQCSRKGLFIFIDSVTYKKVNGDDAYLPINPSNVQVQKLVMNKERKFRLKRKKS